MAPRSHVAWGMVGRDYQLAGESADALSPEDMAHRRETFPKLSQCRVFLVHL